MPEKRRGNDVLEKERADDVMTNVESSLVISKYNCFSILETNKSYRCGSNGHGHFGTVNGSRDCIFLALCRGGVAVAPQATISGTIRLEFLPMSICGGNSLCNLDKHSFHGLK